LRGGIFTAFDGATIDLGLDRHGRRRFSRRRTPTATNMLI
jgi:hypothetical protein